jgi:hypothetical protein
MKTIVILGTVLTGIGMRFELLHGYKHPEGVDARVITATERDVVSGDGVVAARECRGQRYVAVNL